MTKQNQWQRPRNVVAALIMGVALVFGVGNPALAAPRSHASVAHGSMSQVFAASATTTHDGFPAPDGNGEYYSKVTNGTAGASARQYQSVGGYGITWVKGSGVTIDASIDDKAADGNGATLRVEYYYGNRTYETRDLRDLDGAGTTVHRSTTFPWVSGVSDWSTMSVTLTVCNGKGAANSDINCGASHGPFHAY